ncbi:MAG: amidase family protein [Acidimicrobiales bacterium]
MFEPDELDHLSVAEWSAGLAAGRWTSQALVERSVARIESLNPVFGAIRCVVPDCHERAAESDQARRSGTVRGPLEGIPVVVKDNIDLAGLPTTGGALALQHSVPERDAALLVRLREAGAVVVGKTNLSELANFLTEAMPSGYSSLGGQVLNPYDTSVTPGGSSSGSATAVALGIVPLAVGTETDGSITHPSECQSLAGMKPTLGLVSRTGILPIAPSQDTAGPMARTAADAALLLRGMAGPDPSDPATAEAAGPANRLADGLDPTALGSARLGVVREFPEEHQDGRQACYRQALEALAATGVGLVDVTAPKREANWGDHSDELTVLRHEFAPAVDRYLAALGPSRPIRSLAELQAWNAAHADEALKFRQVHVDAAVAIDHGASAAEYREARRRDLQTVVAILEEALGDGLEAVVLPGSDYSGLAARSGWPSIVVPAGYDPTNRRPVGMMLISRPWTDARLLSLAHGLEQANPVRRPPWAVNPAEFRRSAPG